jgi:hypothetical protein
MLITIHGSKLSHIRVVTGAVLNIMSMHAFEALWILISGLSLVPLIRGFSYGLMERYDNISLPVIFGEVDSFPLKHILFNILDFDLTYNAIIEIMTLYQYQNVATTIMSWH